MGWEMPETHHESMTRDLGEFKKDPRCGSYIDYRFPRGRMRGMQTAHNGGLGHVMGENRPIPRLPGFHRPTSPQLTRANLGINESTVNDFRRALHAQREPLPEDRLEAYGQHAVCPGALQQTAANVPRPGPKHKGRAVYHNISSGGSLLPLPQAEAAGG